MAASIDQTLDTRMAAVGIPTPLAVEFLKQIAAEAGYDFKNVKRLIAIGVPPVSADAIASELGQGGLIDVHALMKGNFLTSVQAKVLADAKNGVPNNVVAPVLSGPHDPPIVGQTLTCTEGTWISNTPIEAVQYNFQMDGVTVQGNTGSTYVVKVGDIGKVPTCHVVLQNGAGNNGADSNALNVVIAQDAPINLTLPVVSGPSTPPRVGDTVTCTQGTWDSSTPITATVYDFQVAGQSFQSGATNTFPIAHEYIGSSIDCKVTVTNSVGPSAPALSNLFGPVVP